MGESVERSVAHGIMNDLRDQILDHLPRLAVFASVAETGSFSQAAKKLHLSKSTVSHHVAVLEEALGVRLLERSTRAVRLTDEGRVLEEAARLVSRAWVGAIQRLEEISAEPLGKLVVTTSDIFAERFVVPAVSAFSMLNPKCQVELQVTPENLDLLVEGIDVAVRSGPLPDSSMGAHLLMETNHVIAATPTLAAQWQAEGPGELAAAPWVDHSARRRRSALTNGEEKLQLAIKPKLEANTAMSFVALVLVGAGFGLVPKALIHEELRAGVLVDACPGWRAEQPLTIHAVTSAPRPSAVKTHRFIEQLKAEFAKAQL